MNCYLPHKPLPPHKLLPPPQTATSPTNHYLFHKLRPAPQTATSHSCPPQRPRGLMDKATVFDTGDCKFESCRGQPMFCPTPFGIGIKPTSVRRSSCGAADRPSPLCSYCQAGVPRRLVFVAPPDMDLSTTCIGRRPPGQQLNVGAIGYGLNIHVYLSNKHFICLLD